LVSINEYTLDINVSPNPTTGILHFSDINSDRVDVITFEGKYLGQMKPIDWRIDLTNYETGFYILKITSGKQTSTFKVLKTN
jgi:hypothetical protein